MRPDPIIFLTTVTALAGAAWWQLEPEYAMKVTLALIALVGAVYGTRGGDQ